MKIRSRILVSLFAVSFPVFGQTQSNSCTSEMSICSSASPDRRVLQASITDQSTVFFSSLFDTSSWPARWQCGIWTPFHGWLYIASDATIGLSYFMIPLILLYFLYKRKERTSFQFIISLFIAFILACGLTHIIDAGIFWWPAYRLSALVRFITAGVSLGTVFSLVKIAPNVLKLKSVDELERMVADRTSELVSLNKKLENEVEQRKLAEKKILSLNAELEERVSRRTEQLENANKELEAFSYSVSHDLRAPLRTINGFSEILLEDHSSRLDEAGSKALDKIIKNATRMGQLIDDLLNFSRLGRIDIRKAKIDMNALVKDVIDELRSSGVKIPASLVVQELAPAHGDFALVKQVWINLISNAIKYSSGKQTPLVEVGMILDPLPTYFVRDNGAGFDMKYGHKLFGVFQRLHKVEEFEGTGVGLAIVKRIVDHHHGKVWAEGDAGVGATFYFVLP